MYLRELPSVLTKGVTRISYAELLSLHQNGHWGDQSSNCLGSREHHAPKSSVFLKHILKGFFQELETPSTKKVSMSFRHYFGASCASSCIGISV